MDLYEELLNSVINEIADAALHREEIKKIAAALVDAKCFVAIQKIKDILSNDCLTDFDTVEEIVLVLEAMGTDGGSRHDFG